MKVDVIDQALRKTAEALGGLDDESPARKGSPGLIDTSEFRRENFIRNDEYLLDEGERQKRRSEKTDRTLARQIKAKKQEVDWLKSQLEETRNLVNREAEELKLLKIEQTKRDAFRSSRKEELADSPTKSPVRLAGDLAHFKLPPSVPPTKPLAPLMQIGRDDELASPERADRRVRKMNERIRAGGSSRSGSPPMRVDRLDLTGGTSVRSEQSGRGTGVDQHHRRRTPTISPSDRSPEGARRSEGGRAGSQGSQTSKDHPASAGILIPLKKDFIFHWNSVDYREGS